MNLITVHFVRKGNPEVGTISVLLMSKGDLAKKTWIIWKCQLKIFRRFSERATSTIKTDYLNQIMYQIDTISHVFNHKKK